MAEPFSIFAEQLFNILSDSALLERIFYLNEPINGERAFAVLQMLYEPKYLIDMGGEGEQSTGILEKDRTKFDI